VALVDRRDRYHAWAKAKVAKLDPPLHTCEAVLSEACFLLQHVPGGSQAVLDLVQKNLVKVGLSVQDEVQALQKLLLRYADVPISLADACMVRLAELSGSSVVWTIDSDFKIYRSNGRSVIPLMIPEDR
jgi:predicted nucleic acid-binding protein